MQRICNYTDYKKYIVDVDLKEFFDDESNIRKAFHAAISLYHLVDWVYTDHKQVIDQNFTFIKDGKPHPVNKASEFANSLSDICQENELLRGIAHAAKHLKLDPPGKGRQRPLNQPTHAANTFVQPGATWDKAEWDNCEWDLGPQVLLQGPNGQDVPIKVIMQKVEKMWQDLFNKNGW